MTEEEKRQQIIHSMEFIEAFDTLIEGSTAIAVLSLDDLTPERWEGCREIASSTAGFLQTLREQIVPMMNKLVDNDALNAHLQTVMLAPEE